jgi:Pyruvate/2-oxoacid:ferredoxin oxidoreductase delta subunit
MAKVQRQIITIDEEKCDGCGNCVPACVEGALRVVDGKARLVKQSYCDGLGACLGDCPQDALHVTTLEVEAYDEQAVLGHLQQTAPDAVERHVAHLREHGTPALTPERSAASVQSSYKPATKPQAAAIPLCPSVQMKAWDEGATAQVEAAQGRARSELHQWPVQLTLLPVRAPFFEGATLTLIADCVPFANPNFHADLLRDSAIAVGCPKLDDGQAYINKVTQILQSNDIRSLKVAYMEVPCCRGLVFIAEQALALSGKDIPFTSEIVSIQ